LLQLQRENLQQSPAPARRGSCAEKITTMPSTTHLISSKFVIRAQDLRSAGPIQGRRRYPGRTGDFSTAAGFQPKPWLARLRRALREDLFTLHYQPIVSLRDGAISHYEALIRLADEDDGSLIAPSAFLPAAERYGLIQSIDRLVVGKVCELMGGELSEHGARVAINLSALSVTDRGMLAHVERELARHGVDPERLVVEVTETAAIGDMALAQSFCEGIQALGSSVALDDFGAGFGSFQYLKQLPFRYLKIDGDFICALPSSHKDRLVVRALVGLARGMGKQTIAEYVGDEATVQLLRGLGVDYAQGFEVGRPRARAEAFAA
jgi:EAL domain-containing protein (putative c-di-GMP-specific phosphodiesterase class I)